MITKRKEVSNNDYYKGESHREILVSATLEFNKNVMREFVKHLGIKADKKKIQQVMKELGNSVVIEFSSKTNDNIVRLLAFLKEMLVTFILVYIHCLSPSMFFVDPIKLNKF